jgi:OOP family OmpA-OmpF porin
MSGGCATGQGLRLGGDADTCILIATIVGGVAGGVAGHQGEGETDEELAGGAAGAAAGAIIGYLLCGEGGQGIDSVAIRANPNVGFAPLRVNLDADVQPAGSGVRYEWALGDGSEARGSQVVHTFVEPGSYDVRLRVTDARGRVSEATTRIDARQREDAAPPAREEERTPTTPEATRRRIVLRGLTFAFDSAVLSEEGRQIVLVATETLKTQPDVRVRILGHTDAKGTDAYNQSLSQRRADLVREAMVEAGINPARLQAIGRGEKEPVASNDTEDGQRQNRRVEFEILD